VVEVVDNGRGVPEADRPRLFERFFRSGAAADVDGTGLGLHLVQTSLRGVGGEVWVEFPDGGETVFAFSLPARRAQDGSPRDDLGDGRSPVSSS
jgi:signal transduction histidine kinase